jgi:HK97 family phage major capsid protein
LLSQYAGLARPGRVTADLIRTQQQPPGTDTISVPKVSQGTAIAAQTADNATITTQDMVTQTVTAAVNTYAGYVDAAVQLYEQSPIAGGLDQIIFQELAAAHAQTINGAILYGTGTSGQVEGILTNTSTTSVTYTATSPTSAGLYQKVAAAVSAISTARFAPPEAIVFHPRRWAWLVSQVDGNGRPLVVPTAGSSQVVNAMAPSESYSFTAPVGSIQGLPVWLDPMIPTNLGASSNEDRIIIARFSDVYAYEGGVKTEVFRDVLSSSLGLRFRLHNYYACTGAKRYPGSIAIIGGTALAATV